MRGWLRRQASCAHLEVDVQAVDRLDARAERVDHLVHDAALEEPLRKCGSNLERLLTQGSCVDDVWSRDGLDRPVGRGEYRAAERKPEMPARKVD